MCNFTCIRNEVHCTAKMDQLSTYLFSALHNATATSFGALHSRSALPPSFYHTHRNTSSSDMPLADTSISEMSKLDTTLLFTVILILPFAIVYLITWSKFNAHQQDCKSPQVPFTIPYTVPYFGSVLAIGLDPIRFVSSIR